MNKTLSNIINSLQLEGIKVTFDGNVVQLENKVCFKLNSKGNIMVYKTGEWVNTIGNEQKALEYILLKTA